MSRNHVCIDTGKKVMSWCYHDTTDVEWGDSIIFLCKGCHVTTAPEGTPDETCTIKVKGKSIGHIGIGEL
jgi:hypothetical protein